MNGPGTKTHTRSEILSEQAQAVSVQPQGLKGCGYRDPSLLADHSEVSGWD